MRCLTRVDVLSFFISNVVPIWAYSTTNPPQAAQKPIGVNFESAEHSYIGNLITLQYPERQIGGKDFAFHVGGKPMSYGLIVALAGDYFGDWQIIGCPKSTSDGWDKDPEFSISRFERTARSMIDVKPDLLQCLLSALNDLENQLCDAVSDRQDPAQTYNKISDFYNNQFGLCPDSGYLHLSLCNWDHFGEDAVKAYKAGHTAALRRASRAFKENDVKGLDDAYYLEAYAQHFLTDLFSAGHLRTPRRQLHRQAALGDGYDKMWPADQACKMQHDEDSAGGLWVTNALGESWAIYGDKELSSSKSNTNLDQTIAAVQSGLDEVWSVFSGRSIMQIEQYKAIMKIPSTKNMTLIDNFTPMFSYKSTDTLSMRTDLDIRSSRPTRELRISAMDYERWVSELLKIERSGPKSNTLAATIDGFLPEVNLTQIQSVGDQGLVINRYGPLLSRNYKRQNLNFCHKKVTEPGLERRSWNMLSQDFVALPTNSTPVNWHSAGYMEDGIIALQGSRSTASSKHLDVLYGLKEGGVVWTHEDDFGDATMAPRRISYGQFCANSEHPALIQQHDGLHVSKFTLNALGNGAKNAPFGQRDSWTTLTAQQTFLYPQVGTAKTHFVSVGHDANTRTYVWTVSSWASHYTERSTVTVVEANIPKQAQEILIHEDRIVRLLPHSPDTGSMRIEVLTLNVSSSQIQVLSSQSFPMTWDLNSVHRKIFLRNIPGSGLALTMLLSKADSHTLTTLVFPPASGDTFSAPISTLIEASHNVPAFTTAYLKSLVVAKAGYQYPNGQRTDAAIMQLFDNYGILGARLLVPKQGVGMEQWQYEVKGQVPAIAGQRSEGVAWVFEE